MDFGSNAGEALAWKATDASGGEFSARVYRVNSEPDADGDVIMPGAIADGTKVAVSLREHDVLKQDAEPAGSARLYHAAGSVVAVGETFDTPRGRQLRGLLNRLGPDAQWSIGWQISSVKSRGPTSAELSRWPDARRIIEKWNAVEISPVSQGACGPSCRTLGSKCASKCDCHAAAKADAATWDDASTTLWLKGQLPNPRPAHLVAWAPSNYEEKRAASVAFAHGLRRFAIREAPALKWFRPTPNAPAGQYLAAHNEVWVRTGLGIEETCKTIIHELAHRRQDERGELTVGTEMWVAGLEGEAEGLANYETRELLRTGALGE